ncbi:hypothetical protein C2845_PM01G16250 [Panicum miliaceum]|uniref:Retroviral polymerase SH3-like domain-containing protein n=1 Tax=Panicum miliaceum TaxID=4540 RepID=A0A3L6TJN1_PANMI|nr:hypothetical protein C2845_PM01G16250 [Panicum miliaceum]
MYSSQSRHTLSSEPDYSHLRVFRCLCFPNTTATTPHKLAPRSAPCVLLGNPDNTKGYRCYDPVTRRVLTSRHVVFDARVPFSSGSLHIEAGITDGPSSRRADPRRGATGTQGATCGYQLFLNLDTSSCRDGTCAIPDTATAHPVGCRTATRSHAVVHPCRDTAGIALASARTFDKRASPTAAPSSTISSGPPHADTTKGWYCPAHSSLRQPRHGRRRANLDARRASRSGVAGGHAGRVPRVQGQWHLGACT